MASTNDMTEKEVKGFIKSILTSTPHVSTMESLQRDFKEHIGQSIPFYKFKYNSLEHFLKSIPDTCTVKGTGSFIQVYPVISDKIAHIDKLVTHQKVNVRGKRKDFHPRRRFQGYNSNFNMARNDYSLTYNNSIQGGSFNYVNHNVNRYQIKNTNNLANNRVDPNSQINKNMSAYKQGQNELGSQLVKERLQHLIDQQVKVGNVSKSSVTSEEASSRSYVEKWIDSNENQIPANAPVGRPVVRSNSSKYNSSKDDSCEKNKEKLNNLPKFETAKENDEEDISNVPKRVQDNLKELISQFADGIWAKDLPGHYQRLFRKELLFMDYGYTGLIDMCMTLTHIFHYARPGRDDFKLYDKSKPLPPSAEKTYTIASYDTGKKLSHEEVLPGLDWSDFEGQIPGDVFRYGKEIPNQFIPEGSKVETILDVVVVEIYDPSKFWFYLGTSETSTVIDDLMDEIQIFYNKPENANAYSIPPAALKEGLYCVQVIYGEYHRAKIVRLLSDTDEYVRVLYIDYGTVAKAPIKGMCFLHSNFAVIPAQAIRCRLANIIPHEKGHPWPRSASDRFRDLVNQRDTKINISYIDWSDEYVCVFLADVTDPDNVVYINEMLVKEGHAQWDLEKQVTPLVMSNFKCIVQNVHLFPTFLELEYGLAPSANEMYSLEEMLVPLHFCIPQYFEVNVQLLSDDKNQIEELENSFYETVKNHRKFTPFNNVDLSTITKPPSIDFEVFGELKAEMIRFCKEKNIIPITRVKEEERQQDETVFCDIDEEMLPCKKKCEYLNRDVKSIQLLNEDRELSESIIKKLENYKLLDSESSTSSDFNKRSPDDSLTCLVPQETKLEELDIYKQSLLDEIVDHEMSTILEQSENELDLSLAGSSISSFRKFIMENANTETDINIFDNPEAFENTSNVSQSSDSIVTPQAFLKNLESKSFNTTDFGGSDGLGYSRCSSVTGITPNSYTETANPFKFDAAFNSTQNLLKDLPDNIPEASSINYPYQTVSADNINSISDEIKAKQEQSNLNLRTDFDLPPFKRAHSLDSRDNFIATLSKTNPFRKYLEDDSDYKSIVSDKTDYEIQESDLGINIDNNANAQFESVPREQFEIKTISSDSHGSDSHGSDSDESVYKEFVSRCTKNKITSSTKSPRSSPTLSLKGEAEPVVNTPAVVTTPPLSTPSPNISVAAAEFVPMKYKASPQYFHWTNNMGYSVPQYTQWSNGTNYPPYSQYPAPGNIVRPPPGFAPLPYQGTPPGYLPNQHMMSPMRRPIYPMFPTTPLHYGPPRQMMPPPSSLVDMPQEKDFYEIYNEAVLKLNSKRNS